ncbi:hypothetical protein [Pseudoxanthomonas sp. Root630]|uniref:hypothetical protein n=1 Tax=Pseudoxanthomonas sp. Root630 TaxID=1736574 RepID=UPI0007037631|nr:hypothetical protein [Pseudoxanthomonas sp. Root630]KRA46374.1 hypothetical protein ASD72_03965 [Pseudoxanthomonas sp. Root630]
MNKHVWKGLLLAACTVAMTGCGDREAERAAAAAAQAAAQEQQADEVAKKYDSAVASRDWDMARIHGVALLDQYPDSTAAKRIGPGLEEVKAQAEGAREQRRMESLWDYSQVSADGGMQRSAAILSKDPVDVDGSGAKPVQLVFRDHPKWRRSSYLVLRASDFAKACYGSCNVSVVADGAAAKRMSANRPDTDEAIAMFIDDNKALWRLARKTKVLEIEFPVKDGGTRKAVFETGGLDGSQMPGWD